MTQQTSHRTTVPLPAVPAIGEEPKFKPGDRVHIGMRYPIGHYRVPVYVRGKFAVVQAVIRPAVNNEEEGFGRNAGWLRHYYRVFIPLSELWPDEQSHADDGLLIEIFETWLEQQPQQLEVQHVRA